MPLFAQQGPSGRFPRVSALIAALRLPASPPGFRHAVPSFDGEDGTSQVPRQPSPCMLRSSIPAEPRSRPPGRAAPTSCFVDVAFHARERVGLRERDFGIHWHSLHARCLRFVATVTRVLLTATQDSLPTGGPALVGRESNPLGCKPGFFTCLASHGFLLDKACLAHHGHGERRRDERRCVTTLRRS